MAGSIEPAFDLVRLALGAGSGFVARTTSFDHRQMMQMLPRHQLAGLSQCGLRPDNHGRRRHDSLDGLIAHGRYARRLPYPQGVRQPPLAITVDVRIVRWTGDTHLWRLDAYVQDSRSR